MAKNEPQRPSVEAILTDIHNTLTEGLEAILAVLKEYAVNDTPIQPAGDIAGTTDEEIEKYLKENPKAKIADVIRALHAPAYNRIKAVMDRMQKPEEKPAKPEEKKAERTKITVEMLRAKISEFAEAFSMNEALTVNEQFGGSRKVSGIPEVAYEKVFIEMDRRLKEKAGVAAEVVKALDEDKAAGGPGDGVITKEDIQKAGGVFVKKYGDPAFRELLAKFVGKGKEAKISQVDPAKYAALHEALANA